MVNNSIWSKDKNRPKWDPNVQYAKFWLLKLVIAHLIGPKGPQREYVKT